MIRNVVMGRLPADADAEVQQKLDEGLAGIAGLQLPGLLAMQVGRDAGLREGGWTFAITNDWVDVAAYRNYDVDPEHGRYRAIIGGVCEQLARVQLELS
jgi:hypothetical protein